MHFDRAGFHVSLLNWYAAHKRDLPWRRTRDPYRIWVSEVMLQQTQVNTVIPYYQRFMTLYPEIVSLAEADLESVLKCWEGLGYYSRARNLQRGCRIIIRDYDGRIPESRKVFITLPGVGDYIASAVLSLAFGLPHPVVDGNVKRVLARMFKCPHPVNRSDAHKAFKAYAVQCFDAQHAADYNQALMELGALICKPRQPICEACPVVGYCRAFQNGVVHKYPRRETVMKIPTKHLVAGVVAKENGHVLIVQRPAGGLLGGLWEFPSGPLQPDEAIEQAVTRVLKATTAIEARVGSHLTQVRHAYSHFKIVMDVFLCDYLAGRVRLVGPVAHRWMAPDRLAELPIHKANHKFIQLLAEVETN